MKLTPRIIIQEIERKEMAFWTEAERKERLEILQKAKACCEEILRDILPNETCGRHHFRQQLADIEGYIRLISVPTHSDHIVDTFDYVLKKMVWGYLGLWVILIIRVIFFEG